MNALSFSSTIERVPDQPFVAIISYDCVFSLDLEQVLDANDVASVRYQKCQDIEASKVLNPMCSAVIVDVKDHDEYTLATIEKCQAHGIRVICITSGASVSVNRAKGLNVPCLIKPVLADVLFRLISPQARYERTTSLTAPHGLRKQSNAGVRPSTTICLRADDVIRYSRREPRQTA